jgi:hypothetical protein
VGGDHLLIRKAATYTATRSEAARIVVAAQLFRY